MIRRRPTSYRVKNPPPKLLSKGNRVSSTGDSRTIKLGSENANAYPDNKIISSKYTAWNFIPKNLYEQFRRIANFYFLCMGLISLVIESPVSPATSILPLIFVILVTAIKQAYEDFLRHRADKEVNNYPVTVIRQGCSQEIQAKKIQVGDLVRIENEQDVPCDIVLLVSSHKESKCFVTTANLDGETNLKSLYCPKSLKRTLTAEELGKLDATIECESPHADLYKFHGRLEFGTKASTLLRQSMITRQQSVRSLHSLDENRRTTIPEETNETDMGQVINRLTNTNLNLNNNCCMEGCKKCSKLNELTKSENAVDLQSESSHGFPNSPCLCNCYKENLDTRRHSSPIDDAQKSLQDLESTLKNLQNALPEKNGRRSSSLSNEPFFKCDETAISKNNSTPDMGRDPRKFPAAVKKHTNPQRNDSLPKSAIRRHKKTDSNVSRVSFNIEPNTRRSTIERRESWTFDRKASLITQRSPSLLSSRRPSLATAEGGLADPLSADNLLLRGAKLKNTDFVYGCAVYTGQDTKLALNSKLTSNKFSTIEKSINKFLLFYLGVMVVAVIISTVLKIVKETKVGYFEKKLRYLLRTDSDDYYNVSFSSVVQDFFSFVVLYNYVIPISLYVTMELQKFLGTLFFEWDLDMFDDKTQQAALCNTSDLNEDLGQIEYLFTDKTGTLTENNMQFKRCSINGVTHLEKDGQLFELPPNGSDINLGSPVDLTNCSEEIELFLLALTLCHTVQVHEEEGEELSYSASSPDEKALVEAMSRLDLVFVNDEDDMIVVEIFGQSKIFRKLEVLEFTSDRKRMSVIIEDEEGVITLYCKGAESAVIPQVSEGPSEETLNHVADFAMRGLRTLVVGYKILMKEEYEVASINIQKARQTLSANREAVVAETYQKVESGLTVLGATGVEDKLQDGVQETLESLRAAGIKVWILTGDKVETAVNISISCGHMKPGSVKFVLTGHKSPRTCSDRLKEIQSKISKDSFDNYGLVIDGESLAVALTHDKDLFRDVCMQCSAVICCRMSPLQKSEVVHLIKNQKCSPVTAAVGDGANDVSMIQEAHVGLGIMGKEGRQAVRCADFAFARFKFVKEALLVHGHWYYLRVATLVQYFFYKNIAFIAPQFYFIFYDGYSTQPLYDSMYLTCFNIFFTSLPILVYGLLEQDYPAECLRKHPKLYTIQAKNSLMTWKHFLGWFTLGVWHSLVVFYVPTYVYMYNSSLMPEGRDGFLETYGSIIYHSSVIVVNLKLLLHSRYWSIAFVGSILLSVIGLLVLSAIYNVVYLTDFTSAIYWSYIILLGSPSFWLLVLIICGISVIPDILIDTFSNIMLSWPKRKKIYISSQKSKKRSLNPIYDTRF